jgi:hypothetical protein
VYVTVSHRAQTADIQDRDREGHDDGDMPHPVTVIDERVLKVVVVLFAPLAVLSTVHPFDPFNDPRKSVHLGTSGQHVLDL